MQIFHWCVTILLCYRKHIIITPKCTQLPKNLFFKIVINYQIKNQILSLATSKGFPRLQSLYVPFTYQICYNIVIWDIQERKYFYKPPFSTDTKAVMKSNPNLHLMLFVAGNERLLLQYFESSFQLSPRSVYIFLSLFRVLKTLLLHKVILYVKEC